MKKFLLTLGLILTLGIAANAATTEIFESFGNNSTTVNTNNYWDPTFPTAYSTSPVEYTSKTTGIVYTVENGIYTQQSNQYFLQLKKDAGYISFTIPQNCTKIKMTNGSGGAASPKVAVTIGENDAKTVTLSSSNAFTYTLPEDYEQGATIKLLASGNALRIAALTFTIEENAGPVEFTEYNKSILMTEGETSNIIFGDKYPTDILFESNDESIVTVSDEGVVTALKPGKTTIDVMWDGDDNFIEGEATINVTVAEKPEAITYTLVKSAADLNTTDEYIIISYGQIDNNYKTPGSTVGTSVSVESITSDKQPETIEVSVDDTTFHTFKIEENGNYKALYDATLKVYYGGPTSNSLNSSANLGNTTAYQLTFADLFNEDLSNEGEMKIFSQAATTRQFQFQSTFFRNYTANTAYKNVAIYKKVVVEAEKIATPVILPAVEDAKAGDKITVTCATENAEVWLIVEKDEVEIYFDVYTDKTEVILEAGTYTVTAFAEKPGWAKSEWVTVTYIISEPVSETVEFTPAIINNATGKEIDVTEGLATGHDDSNNGAAHAIRFKVPEGFTMWYRIEIADASVAILDEDAEPVFTQYKDGDVVEIPAFASGALHYYGEEIATGKKSDVTSIAFDNGTSGVSAIEADANAAVEYFNLQGVRVAQPSNGLYIVRRGNTVTKELVK